jgi:hypothetical protein
MSNVITEKPTKRKICRCPEDHSIPIIPSNFSYYTRFHHVYESTKKKDGDGNHMTAIRQATKEEVQTWCNEQTHAYFCGHPNCCFSNNQFVKIDPSGKYWVG